MVGCCCFFKQYVIMLYAFPQNVIQVYFIQMIRTNHSLVGLHQKSTTKLLLFSIQIYVYVMLLANKP